MALTDQIVQQITVEENGVLSVKTTTRIFRDGVPIAEAVHRGTLEPGQDVTNESAKVRRIAAGEWTKDVVDARKADIEAIRLQRSPRP